jgi:hypothetical protein
VTGSCDAAAGPASRRALTVLGLCLVAAGPVLAGGASAHASGAADEPVPAQPLFSFQDPEITESSGLADTGALVFTVNDSGSGPVLYAVDPRTGETTGTTTYSDDDVTDVEALAPGQGGALWVGDIGDNPGKRESVAVYRVTPGGAPAPRFELTYPGGARDAETMLVHPRTGRLFVVSKTPFGGVVYAAPRQLDTSAPNRMTEFARVSGLLTDGSFLPDGEHVLLRTYGAVSLYTYPGFDLLGSALLPDQDQGEGLSVGPDGRVLVSSEGQHSEVLRLDLPPEVSPPAEGPDAPGTEPTPGRPSPRTPDEVTDAARPEESDGGELWGLAAVGALVVGAGVAAFALRRAHRGG